MATPRRFDELTGQEHVLQALSNALETNRVHHAFLFTGTRGVGKTTIARILAKCLNCETGMGPAPCGTCATCREIDEGRFVDLIEVDAASRTKVDDTRELLDNVQYAPTRGRYKVYLIDEVHMLSTHSFNALLKTLEEPPPHVKFLLATTDPQKLPVTVLSRCLQFNLKRLSVSMIADRMKVILKAENIEFEPAAVRLIAEAADGSMRDGLSLLDQLLAFGGGKVAESEARAMLATVDRKQVFQLARLLGTSDPAELMRFAQSLDEWAPDYGDVLDALATLLVRVALKQTLPTYEGDELHPPEQLAVSLTAADATFGRVVLRRRLARRAAVLRSLRRDRPAHVCLDGSRGGRVSGACRSDRDTKGPHRNGRAPRPRRCDPRRLHRCCDHQWSWFAALSQPHVAHCHPAHRDCHVSSAQYDRRGLCARHTRRLGVLRDEVLADPNASARRCSASRSCSGVVRCRGALPIDSSARYRQASIIS